jgi:hypothetical protein
MTVAERTRVELPEHIPATFDVYVSGVRQEPGTDYEVELAAPSAEPTAPCGTPRSPAAPGGGRVLVFPRPLAQEGKLGFWRWAGMWLGVVGSYRKHETVDIAYEADGRRHVETGLRPMADPPGLP